MGYNIRRERKGFQTHGRKKFSARKAFFPRHLLLVMFVVCLGVYGCRMHNAAAIVFAHPPQTKNVGRPKKVYRLSFFRLFLRHVLSVRSFGERRNLPSVFRLTHSLKIALKRWNYQLLFFWFFLGYGDVVQNKISASRSPRAGRPAPPHAPAGAWGLSCGEDEGAARGKFDTYPRRFFRLPS